MRNLFGRGGLPPILITESIDEFRELHAALAEELGPRAIIEQFYVEDLVLNLWETRRLQRLRIALINMKYSNAIETLVLPHLDQGEDEYFVGEWFQNPELVKLRSKILKDSQLGEAALDATAFLEARKAISSLDKMLERLARQRERLLLTIEERRVRLAKPVRKSTTPVLQEPEYHGELGATGAN